MAFQSLYRRYRPRTFGEVLGQEHVTTALQNAARDDRIAHGYLFCGPRGTGKTSTARLLAKVLNCAAPVDGEPCGECDACQAVEHGTLVDWLQELDAASNNKVDDMRDLLARVPMGTSGNRKVIILDEVHMLSAGASNALLKTLEEPPDHVVFVLATTEPHKVLPTIQSRTQRFDFRLLGADVLADHVRHVIADADLDLGDDAVDEAVRRGGGSARDTLSALDQIAAAGGVLDDGAPVDDVVEALVDADAGRVLAAVAVAVESGQDPRTIAGSLVGRLRDAFLAAMRAPARATAPADRERAEHLAARTSPARLTAAIEAIGTASVDMRQAPDPRIPLEVALVRLCRIGDLDTAALLERIEALEAALAGGAPTPAAPRPASTTTGSTPPAKPAPAPAAPTSPQRQPDDPAGGSAKATGKASAARERLARSAGSQEVGEEPARGDARPPLGRQATAEPEAGPGEAPTDPSPDPEPTPAGTSAPPTRDELVMAWADEILPQLPRSALFKVGRFVGGSDGTYTFALPNAPHRDNCEKRRPELEAALTGHFGVPIRLEMIADDQVAPGSSTAPLGASPAPSDDDPDDELIDPESLIDAGEAPSPVDRLSEAFPGAEVVSGDGGGS